MIHTKRPASQSPLTATKRCSTSSRFERLTRRRTGCERGLRSSTTRPGLSSPHAALATFYPNSSSPRARLSSTRQRSQILNDHQVSEPRRQTAEQFPACRQLDVASLPDYLLGAIVLVVAKRADLRLQFEDRDKFSLIGDDAVPALGASVVARQCVTACLMTDSGISDH